MLSWLHKEESEHFPEPKKEEVEVNKYSELYFSSYYYSTSIHLAILVLC